MCSGSNRSKIFKFFVLLKLKRETTLVTRSMGDILTAIVDIALSASSDNAWTMTDKKRKKERRKYRSYGNGSAFIESQRPARFRIL